MIKSLQAIFYITWIIVGIIVIVSTLVLIAAFPFEKINDYLKVGTTEQQDVAGPPAEFGSNQNDGGAGSNIAGEGPSINIVVTDEMRREVAKIIGEERARQFRGYEDLTPGERKKLEEYWGPRTPWLGQR